MKLRRVDRTPPWPSRQQCPVEALREKPVEFVIARVRRYTSLAISYLLHVVFGIDEQTRRDAVDLTHGALDLALDTAADNELLHHPGSAPLLNLLRLILSLRDAHAAASPGAILTPAATN